ncbi:MAG: insulinase family protein [Prevotella sp.]|nr:insulinase family protein [Prevotella sp.]
MTRYNTATLSNGLRVIHRPDPSPVVYCGIGINAGSRHEAAGEAGVAHFCEHVSFKGTSRRTSMQILNCLESVGGDLNAFTNKEDTVFYAAIQREHIARAVDLLCDIVFCSTYPQEEVGREIDVICDEIESYNDSPAELIYDEFENQLFSGHPLGHNILGTREQVLAFSSAHAQRFTNKYYLPANAIFFACGDIAFERLVNMLERQATVGKRQETVGKRQETVGERQETNGEKQTMRGEGQDNGSDAAQPAPEALPAAHLSPVGGQAHHQAHVMMGCTTFGYDDERRMPLYLLNNILGGPGMNARLNLSLRERNGLVYTVESSMATYSDTGCWSVYFGCDHHDVKRCMRLVRRELDRMVQHPLGDRQLAAAKRQLKGQLAIACDNREQFTLDMGKHFLHYGQERDIELLMQRIDAITAQQVQDVAQQMFAADRMHTLIL